MGDLGTEAIEHGLGIAVDQSRRAWPPTQQIGTGGWPSTISGRRQAVLLRPAFEGG